MSSEISGKLKPEFKNNIGRHWPIWTGYLFLLVLTGPFSLFMSNSNHSFVDKRDFLYGLSTVMNICASPIILSIFITGFPELFNETILSTLLLIINISIFIEFFLKIIAYGALFD